MPNYWINVLRIVFLVSGVTRAIVINIPQDFNTIQDGIDSSSNGDTILIAPGAYHENINFQGKDIIVGSLFILEQDSSYISQTEITGDTASSIVVFENGEDSTSKLIGLTIRDGFGTLLDPDIDGTFDDYGGGILCINSSPSLTNLNITGNYINSGGGAAIYLSNSSSLINHVKIYNNTSDNFGGGIYCDNYSSLKILNSEIYSNSASWGGQAVYCHDSSNVIIRDSKMHSNLGANLGVVYIKDSPNSILTDVEIADNLHTTGLYLGYSKLFINRVIIHDNIGAGMRVWHTELYGVNCEFHNNTFHGIIVSGNAFADLYNVEIYSNSTNGFGGGIYITSSFMLNTILRLTNSLLHGNTSSIGVGSNIHSYGGELILINTTLANSFIDSTSYGSSILLDNEGSLMIVNSILYSLDYVEIDNNGSHGLSDIVIGNTNIHGYLDGIERWTPLTGHFF
ncbi:MAG: right-handed parallel beta-helix repeat-containing protein [Bacteroidetes bacterium]|nr:right-handed parallel beta-helix repeat-containing protein [Bacteroidota bacterium]